MSGAGDIIVAAATPPGRSARAMVRFSGPDLSPIIQQYFDGDLPPREPLARRLRLGETIALPVLATHLPGPASYTGEDTLEIQLPGNPALIERVLLMFTELRGVRLAEAGEFTRRAYLNGRVDLTAAEGIAATIGAVSDAQLQAAGMLRRGQLGQWAATLVDELAQLLALVEAGIDFIDQDDVVAIAPGRLLTGLEEAAERINQLLRRSRAWGQLEALPRVVLVGQPNVGKSTLFNALLGRDRAVTSNVAGTTRDVLAEPLSLTVGDRQAEVMLVDVAGFDAATLGLNRHMQAAADDAMSRAELILHLVDSDRAPEPGLPAKARLSNDRLRRLTVRTKIDLCPNRDDDALPVDLAVSPITGEGLDDLRRMIADRIGDRAVALAGEAMALQPRHQEELRGAAAAIRQAIELTEPQRDRNALSGPELIAEPMRAALDRLAQLGGDMSPDEVIGKVFATFCVGK